MRIAAYCRVSTDKDEQLDSLEHQKEFFTEYAKKTGNTLVRLYADEGISGMSLKKREEFKRLMFDAKLGLFDMVVVKDISRFARNTVDFLQNIRTLKSYGINTVFLTANMQSLGESEFVLTIFSALAQEESVNLSKRVKFGKKINAQKGRVPKCVFGYNRIDNYTLEINSEEAQTVKMIYHMYLDDGLGCWKISQILNGKGIKSKLNSTWDCSQIRRILKNPIYCGKYENNKYEIIDCLTKKQVRISEDQHYHHERPQWTIISEELFNKVQQTIETRRKIYSNSNPCVKGRYSSQHIFSTLIKCEHCGYSYRRLSRNTSRPYWTCSSHNHNTSKPCSNAFTIKEDLLLEFIRDYFSSLISDKDAFIKEIIGSVEKQVKQHGNPENINELKKRRNSLLTKKEKYQEMYVADILTLQEVKEKISQINSQLNELDQSLSHYEQFLNATNSNEIISHYIKKIESFLSLTDVTNAEMREILDHITINDTGEIKIYLRDLRNLIYQ